MQPTVKFGKLILLWRALVYNLALRIIYLAHGPGGSTPPKGAFTLARFRGQFRTKFAHLVMKKNV